ncbi:MAG: ComEA family DNA-binding protein [Oscillatoria sp. PMC 1051.18]|nr:ComEA family DNA-binding protein [Oscillatoria sp. PMC 1050.18]MEC5032031.1 ComEA family DNA-binding protein [Oscillatoria sp. PMC 1051.18]
MGLSDWLAAKGQQINPQRLAIRARIANDPYYRFQSMAEVAVAAELGIKIDVNQAGVDDWLRLPGISIRQARSLVELSGLGVQFLCIEDLAAALSIPPLRLQPLEPILYFAYYNIDGLSTPQRFNPNTASVEELAKIPVIEPAIAQIIVENRLAHGNYRNLADLQHRLSLSSQLISHLMHYLQF